MNAPREAYIYPTEQPFLDDLRGQIDELDRAIVNHLPFYEQPASVEEYENYKVFLNSCFKDRMALTARVGELKARVGQVVLQQGRAEQVRAFYNEYGYGWVFDLIHSASIRQQEQIKASYQEPNSSIIPV